MEKMLSLPDIENFTVIAEFGLSEPEPEYIIMYQDGQGTWENAVGRWNDALSVSASYSEEGIARKVAETLYKVFNKPFIVVKEMESEDD